MEIKIVCKKGTLLYEADEIHHEFIDISTKEHFKSLYLDLDDYPSGANFDNELDDEFVNSVNSWKFPSKWLKLNFTYKGNKDFRFVSTGSKVYITAKGITIDNITV